MVMYANSYHSHKHVHVNAIVPSGTPPLQDTVLVLDFVPSVLSYQMYCGGVTVNLASVTLSGITL